MASVFTPNSKNTAAAHRKDEFMCLIVLDGVQISNMTTSHEDEQEVTERTTPMVQNDVRQAILFRRRSGQSHHRNT